MFKALPYQVTLSINRNVEGNSGRRIAARLLQRTEHHPYLQNTVIEARPRTEGFYWYTQQAAEGDAQQHHLGRQIGAMTGKFSATARDLYIVN